MSGTDLELSCHYGSIDGTCLFEGDDDDDAGGDDDDDDGDGGDGDDDADDDDDVITEWIHSMPHSSQEEPGGDCKAAPEAWGKGQLRVKGQPEF